MHLLTPFGVPLATPTAGFVLISVIVLSAGGADPVAVPAAVSMAGVGSAQVDTVTTTPTTTSRQPAGSSRVSGMRGSSPNGLAASPTSAGPVVPHERFGWPLSPRPVVHRRLEQPRTQWSSGHRGVDLLAAVGQPVLIAGEGLVAFSGVVACRGVITVAHSGGLRTSYEPVDERLAAGAHVHRGTRIGVVSSTAGHCLPVHCVHWGAIRGHTYQDPLALLGLLGRPILLPLG